MNGRGWLIQIYAISNAAVQEMIRSLLAVIDSVTVQATRRGADLFLVVESFGDEEAWCIHRFITSADPGASLLHASAGEGDPVRHRGPKVESLRSLRP
jgi:hypothetical protein